MKGLLQIPSLEDLARAYDGLRGDQLTLSELALWSQWSRFDPRLAEILVSYLARNWKKLDLFALRTELLAQPWPSAFGVLVENAVASRLVQTTEVGVFRAWAATLLSGVSPACDELFFFGTRKLGSAAMVRDAAESSITYRRWGYLGRDLLVNKANPSAFKSIGSTLLPASVRERLRHELARSRARFTIHDYQTTLDFRVSRRQAELDLARDPEILAVGRTRARFYRRK